MFLDTLLRDGLREGSKSEVDTKAKKKLYHSLNPVGTLDNIVHGCLDLVLDTEHLETMD